MERWRWIPAELVAAPIIVTFPSSACLRSSRPPTRRRTCARWTWIVGKSFDSTQTRYFAAEMSYLSFRPYWEVPYSIALKEIVPAGRRSNPAGIEKRQMEISPRQW